MLSGAGKGVPSAVMPKGVEHEALRVGRVEAVAVDVPSAVMPKGVEHPSRSIAAAMMSRAVSRDAERR